MALEAEIENTNNDRDSLKESVLWCSRYGRIVFDKSEEVSRVNIIRGVDGCYENSAVHPYLPISLHISSDINNF